MAIITPKYDNDYITYGYYKNDNGDLEKMQEEINKIPKSYSSPPTPPYNVGDILYYNNNIYKCITARTIGDFSFDDWEIVSESNKEYKEWLETTYDINKLDIEEQTDGKIETFYQTNDPSSSWTTDLIKNTHIGDYWKSGDIIKKYVRYNTNPITYGWELSKITSTLFNENTGHKNIFIKEPTSYSQYDYWYIDMVDENTPDGINIGDWVYATTNRSTYNKNDFVKLTTNIELEQINEIYTSNDKIVELKKETTEEINRTITTEIGSLTSEIINKYTTKDEFTTETSEMKTSISQNASNISLMGQRTYTKEEINNINSGNDENNKVSFVKTSILTIDENGFKVEQNGKNTETDVDAEGLVVMDKNIVLTTDTEYLPNKIYFNSNKEKMVAGIDYEVGDTITGTIYENIPLLQVHLEQGDGVVRTKNIYVNKYLAIGNIRVEDGVINGEKCSCFFWIGD